MDITIYSTHTCPYCRMAKQYFDSHGIKYKEIYVDADRNAATEMINKSGQMGVPVIDINGQIIVGYNVQAIEGALKKAK